MDHIDLYSDVAIEDLQNRVSQLQQEKEGLLSHIEDLQSDIDKLCKELLSMKTGTNNLERNISELYKTAKCELERKDRTIMELRKEIETLQCRAEPPSNPHPNPDRNPYKYSANNYRSRKRPFPRH